MGDGVAELHGSLDGGPRKVKLNHERRKSSRIAAGTTAWVLCVLDVVGLVKLEDRVDFAAIDGGNTLVADLARVGVELIVDARVGDARARPVEVYNVGFGARWAGAWREPASEEGRGYTL